MRLRALLKRKQHTCLQLAGGIRSGSAFNFQRDYARQQISYQIH